MRERKEQQEREAAERKVRMDEEMRRRQQERTQHALAKAGAGVDGQPTMVRSDGQQAFGVERASRSC